MEALHLASKQGHQPGAVDTLLFVSSDERVQKLWQQMCLAFIHHRELISVTRIVRNKTNNTINKGRRQATHTGAIFVFIAIYCELLRLVACAGLPCNRGFDLFGE